MNSRKSLILFVLAGMALYAFYLGTSNGSHVISDLVGKRAPDFTLKDERGEKVTLTALKGKVVLLHFWATWCAPCVREFPLLEALYQKLKDTPFVLLAVSMDEGGKKSITAFRKEVSLTFHPLLNPDQSVADQYGTFRLPESYLINKEGNVVQKIVGPQDWTKPQWEKRIRELLKD